jgi:exopolyphosphatase/guanosine-5'-triphosphate,3'-diphosphate pyrophosphatase
VSPERVAVIDIGTNTLLLLVAERRDGGLVALHDQSRFGRLGRGVDRSKRLDPAAVARSLEILADYRATLDRLGVRRVAAIGTQALREAVNAADFVGPAEALLGAEIAVIAGEREAALAFGAVVGSARELRLAPGPLVVVDVGGGSSEIILGHWATGGARMERYVSLALGCVRHTERHLRSDPPGAAEVRELERDIDAILDPVDLPRGGVLVGTGGTASNLAAVDLALPRYDPARINGHRLAPSAVRAQRDRFLALPVAERRAVVGLEPERADVIAAGAVIYERLLHHVQPPALVVSDRGVRWGLAYELAGG